MSSIAPARGSSLHRLRRAIACAVLGGGLAASNCVAGAWHFGSAAAFSAALRGDSFAVTPATIDLGAVKVGSERTVAFSVRNLSNVQVRVVGAQTSCTCVTTGTLPMSVPPGAERDVSVRVHVNRPVYQEHIALHVDVGRLETRVVTVSASGTP